MKKKIGAVLLVLIMALALGLPAPPAVHAASPIYVDADASGLNNGSSWENAYTDLQDALTNLTTDKEIWVAAGTYKPGTDRTDSFQLKSNVAVYGGFAGTETSRGQRNWLTNETILSGEIGTDGTGDNSYHVVTSMSTNGAILDGFTITDGNANGTSQGAHDRGAGMYNNDNSSPTVTNCIFRDNNSGDIGGGMQNSNSSPTVTDCTFEYNSAISAGGGMYNNNSSPTVDDCTFRDNSASQGGGMQNSNSSPTVTDCTFSGNSASHGGGMQNYNNSSPTVTRCTFSENSAGYGGGMYNLESSSPMVTNCVFSENSADGGGGMSNKYSSPTVTNCIFSGNSAGYVGGGMYNDHSSPTVTNCTFSDNSAVGYGGGGMYNNYSSSSPTVTNCILWDNSPDQIKNWNNSSPNVTYCDVQNGYTGTTNIALDPMFADPDNGVFHLLSDSPCIDAGSNAAVPDWLTTDFDGDDRIIDGDNNGTATVDMGADEFVIEMVTATVDIDPDTLNLKSKGVFTAYITLPEGYNVADIDVSTVQCEGAVAIRGVVDGDVLIAKFDREDLAGVPAGDEVTLTVTGNLIDGPSFAGSDTIRVINTGD